VDRETRLGLLASAILDGAPVDWPSEHSSTEPSDSGVVRDLQIVAEIAALHRNLDVPPDVSPAAPAALDETRPAATWGHLRLLEAVGYGAFGEVHRAWDTHLDRQVALKLLRAGPMTGGTSLSVGDPTRVVTEGRLLARVRHPNVITVYGAEPRDGRIGIWMEFIRGRTLQNIVEQQGPLGPREAVAVGIDLCQALAAVHRAGLLHRDVTARNVMREDGGRVVLMDFGAGHEHGPSASAQAGYGVLGTPLYMAPELFSGGEADQRTDIYALGALLYYLVTRTYPVTGKSLTEIREAHARGQRARLRDVRPDLPAPFIKAIEQATAAAPADRFQTAGDFEAALDLAVGTSRPEVAASPSPVARWWLALGATAVLAAIAWVAAPSRDLSGSGTSGASQGAAAVATITARKQTTPAGVSVLSNPSDDGRYAAAMVNETGDVAIVDLLTGDYRPLGISRGDGSNGYASISALSPDGTAVAVDWHIADKGALHVVRSDGSDHRILIDTAADVGVYQWSRDGSLILVVVTAPDGTNTISLVAANDGAVRPIRAIGTAFPELMSLSPDARYVAFDYPQAPNSRDRDILILDTLTGAQWPLDAKPSHDSAPLWSPDGRAIVFVSDRNRALSAWMAPITNGRLDGEPRLVKHDIGRVWPRGFTRAGALHYQLWTGFAEVYVGELDGRAPSPPQPMSPRQALSNFYPIWSPDGRFIVYTSERRADDPRELWVYDTETRQEARIPADQKLGRPLGWSPDGQRVMTTGQNDPRVFVVDRTTGRTQLVAKSSKRPYWLPEGIVFADQKVVVLQDPSSGRRLRSYDFSDTGITGFDLGLDGRTAMALWKNGRVSVREVVSGTTREWHDPGLTRLGLHAMAPHVPMVAYTGFGKDGIGDWASLRVSSGAGDPRELIRVRGQERLLLAGWTPDGMHVLVTRWTQSPPDSPAPAPSRALWRVPVGGGAPVSTGINMDSLRDISINPDGRRVAFNSGFKTSEMWILENLLAK
jgi:dipeptidyl aminopeptidase/acylaminoacyl peptidase